MRADDESDPCANKEATADETAVGAALAAGMVHVGRQCVRVCVLQACVERACWICVLAGTL